MSTLFRTIAIVLIHSLIIVNSAKILAVFSNPSYSHHQVFNSLVDAFLDDGHDVVVITVWPVYPKEQVPANLTQIDVKDISLKIWNEDISKIMMEAGTDMITLCGKTLKIFIKIMVKQFEANEVIKLFGNDNFTFDLLVTESLMKMPLMISHYYKVPVIEINSFGPIYGDMANFGAPSQPRMYPQSMRKRIYNLTLLEELSELYIDLGMQDLTFNQLYLDAHDAMKETIFKSAPIIDVLQDNVHLLYVNTNPIWDVIRPVPLPVIYTYGIHQKPHKELPKELSSYLDSSAKGVVYVSFGTSADVKLYSEKVQILLNAFSKLPYDFLLKWPEDVLAGKPDNVKIAKWLPQADLLKHPNVKVFITQCGIQSTDEAIDAGVPLIGMPLVWDQWANAERYVVHKIGIKLEINDVTEEEMINAINTLITDTSYRRNIIKLRELLLDAPQTSQERALWWAHYLLRHGGTKHLRAPAACMSYSEFFEIELFSILFACSALIIIIIRLLLIKYLLPSYYHGVAWFKSKFVHVDYKLKR
ncbi:UDP-glycosyltransferase UGT5-like [Achroia grisella]|uniref:UDP-glycosyltransferase UGT5-like n=1 Tax=Achroia grisella TaxID=688607 RepID=UPI0027D30C13|nr:UDP-glycosyltransferase UGT5-like [Achroia grisella]